MDGTAQFKVEPTASFEPFADVFAEEREPATFIDLFSNRVLDTSLLLSTGRTANNIAIFHHSSSPTDLWDSKQFNDNLTLAIGVAAVMASTQRHRPSSNTLPASLSANWGKFSGISLPLYSRLVALAAKPDGWRGPGSKRLKASSVASFSKFWQMARGAMKDPFVTLSPSGNLFAEWHASWQRHLDIEFDEKDAAFFGLFNTTSIFEGKASVKELADMLLAHKKQPLLWSRK